MLGNYGREIPKAIFSAPARALARLGITPDSVTIAGTLATVIISVILLSRGYLVAAPIALGMVLFADSLDGTLARITGKESKWGAFLDSSLDRISDGAVFGAIIFYGAHYLPHSYTRTWILVAAIIAIVGGGTVPYVRAKGESIGVVAKVGIAERTDRLLIALVAVFCVGIGAWLQVLALALSWVALASFITVMQRITYIRRAMARD